MSAFIFCFAKEGTGRDELRLSLKAALERAGAGQFTIADGNSRQGCAAASLSFPGPGVVGVVSDADAERVATETAHSLGSELYRDTNMRYWTEPFDYEAPSPSAVYVLWTLPAPVTP